MAIAAMIKIIATTISNSMREKPFWFFFKSTASVHWIIDPKYRSIASPERATKFHCPIVFQIGFQMLLNVGVFNVMQEQPRIRPEQLWKRAYTSRRN